MSLLRGLDQLLADLDRRARPQARSRNVVVSKFASITDTVTLSSDSVTATEVTTPFLWASSTGIGPQGSDLYWGFGEWS